MSDHQPKKKKSSEPRAHGWVAEYEDENKLLDAARRVRDSGYTRTDAFTPFPVHGIDEALGIKPTVLPWFTLCAGATGTTVALTMQIWMNGIDYQYIISGKPFISLPAFIPVAFELTVLFAAYTTVFAMLGLNKLPCFSNPMFTNPKFDRSTDDRFFLWVDAADKYFNSDKVRGLLSETGAATVEEVREDETSNEIPRWLFLAIFAGILASLIPGAIVLNMRNSKSGSSRFHVFFDMDFQPKRKTQTPMPTSIFKNGRVQQHPVAGTIARGTLGSSDEFLLGYTPSDEVADVAHAAEGDEAAAADALPQHDWVTEFPLDVDENLYALGKAKFEQNCSVCHGFGGYGDGLVSQRAASFAQGHWTTPTSMHAENVQVQSVGQLFNTVGNGKGKMAGYAASLTPRERWAVVLYVRALQRSQNATPEDVASN